MSLNRFESYSRQQVCEIFEPETTFTPSAGFWGLQGFVPLKERPGDYVFFVTFGKVQEEHEFDEGLSKEGVLRWQSQPKQTLSNKHVLNWIGHNENVNTIYLFLRSSSAIKGQVAPYHYLGILKYLAHEPHKEQPVNIAWQVLDWEPEDRAFLQTGIPLEDVTDTAIESIEERQQDLLVAKEAPVRPNRAPVQNDGPKKFRPVRSIDYAKRDAANRKLGERGELLVMKYEHQRLIEAGKPELAAKVRHVSKEIGDGAGYDVGSYTEAGAELFIEVKTTKGPADADFYISANELAFSKTQPDHYKLYRLYDYDEGSNSAQFYELAGDVEAHLKLEPTIYKVSRFQPVDDA
jgi:hypothetical protein